MTPVLADSSGRGPGSFAPPPVVVRWSRRSPSPRPALSAPATRAPLFARVVVIAAPFTPETHHIIGAELFNRMKPTAYFLVESRGGIVDEAALLDSLRHDRGLAVILITHDLGVLSALADRVAVLYGGRLADLAMCISSSDTAAPAGEVNSISGARPCLLENTATVVKMLRELGDADAMAMLVTAYYH